MQRMAEENATQMQRMADENARLRQYQRDMAEYQRAMAEWQQAVVDVQTRNNAIQMQWFRDFMMAQAQDFLHLHNLSLSRSLRGRGHL
ncbi:hypothetical protein OROMI_026901 [Orobanche minor]